MVINTKETTNNTVLNRSATNIPFKILMVGSLPLDLGLVKGGVEAVIMNLFAGFKTIPDVRVIHLAFTKEIKHKQVVDVATNVSVHFMPFRIKSELIDYFINRNALREVIEMEKPDIIHIQEITPHILRFLTFPKSNIVVTQHGIMKEELKYASGIQNTLKCLFKMYVERYVFPLFDNVIFISEYNRRLYPGAPSNSIRIYNPVNPAFFQYSSNDKATSNRMMYVGVLSKRKNIGLIIEALHELKMQGIKFHLDVAGGFKDRNYEKVINTMVSRYALSDQITFHGWVSQEKMRILYDQCAIFILPSQQETLPVSIAEAMALGKVVVASDVGAVNEMFEDGKSGFLFKKNDKADLVRVLTFLFNSGSTQLYGEHAKEEARKKYDPSLIAQKTIGFYQEISKLQAPN